MSMDFGFEVISAEEYDRQRVLYEPLTAAIRRLIDAGIHTDVDEDTAREAQATVEAFDEIGGALVAILALQLRHFSNRSKIVLAAKSRHGIIRTFVQ